MSLQKVFLPISGGPPLPSQALGLAIPAQVVCWTAVLREPLFCFAQTSNTPAMSTNKRSVPEITGPAERQIIQPRSKQAELIMLRDLTRLLREYRLYLKRRNDRLAALLDKP